MNTCWYLEQSMSNDIMNKECVYNDYENFISNWSYIYLADERNGRHELSYEVLKEIAAKNYCLKYRRYFLNVITCLAYTCSPMTWLKYNRFLMLEAALSAVNLFQLAYINDDIYVHMRCQEGT